MLAIDRIEVLFKEVEGAMLDTVHLLGHATRHHDADLIEGLLPAAADLQTALRHFDDYIRWAGRKGEKAGEETGQWDAPARDDGTDTSSSGGSD